MTPSKVVARLHRREGLGPVIESMDAAWEVGTGLFELYAVKVANADGTTAAATPLALDRDELWTRLRNCWEEDEGPSWPQVEPIIEEIFDLASAKAEGSKP